jgi:antitoxin ParD1/3/4
MNVSLTPELEKLVNEKVASGLYSSASEVVRDGLRLLSERDEIKQSRLRELRRDLSAGARQIKQGNYKEYSSGGELIDDIQKRGQKRIEDRRKGK